MEIVQNVLRGHFIVSSIRWVPEVALISWSNLEIFKAGKKKEKFFTASNKKSFKKTDDDKLQKRKVTGKK